MTRSGLLDLLRNVQDIIAKETGQALQGEAKTRLERVLRNPVGYFANSATGEDFSSREVTILLADLRGFTAITETHPIAGVLELLNRYLRTMSEVVIRHQGTIDKFMGDAILVIFGAPESREDDARRAVACAVEMQIAMDGFNRHHRRFGTPELFMGIGVNTGSVMAGVVGSELYSEYTVIGNEVNLAARIEAFSLRGQVLISPRTFDLCRGYAQTGAPMEVYVKGRADPVAVREVLSVPSLQLEVPRKEVRRSPRVEVRMPFSYQLMEDKIVMPAAYPGSVLDIGYHGMLAALHQELAPHSEVKVNVDLSLVGYTATDIYAKVIKTQKHEERYLSGLEFTSVGPQTESNVKHFVQLLLQGSVNK